MSKVIIAALATALAAPLAAQQQVPFRNNIPVAPQGLSVPSLPPAPVRYETAEGQNIEVTVLVRGSTRPWSLAFVADDTILVTERAGRVRVIRAGKLDPEPVAGVPEVRVEGLGGLMDVVLHPAFATQRPRLSLVYQADQRRRRRRGDCARPVGRTCAARHEDVFAGAETAGGARMAFGGDGMLYVSAGGGGDQHPQDPNSHGGKVLRLTADGGVPADNPFVGRAGYKPEIYTLGHRNTLGLAVHPRPARSGSSKSGRTVATRSTCSCPAATTAGR